MSKDAVITKPGEFCGECDQGFITCGECLARGVRPPFDGCGRCHGIGLEPCPECLGNVYEVYLTGSEMLTIRNALFCMLDHPEGDGNEAEVLAYVCEAVFGIREA